MVVRARRKRRASARVLALGFPEDVDGSRSFLEPSMVARGRLTFWSFEPSFWSTKSEQRSIDFCMFLAGSCMLHLIGKHEALKHACC